MAEELNSNDRDDSLTNGAVRQEQDNTLYERFRPEEKFLQEFNKSLSNQPAALVQACNHYLGDLTRLQNDVSRIASIVSQTFVNFRDRIWPTHKEKEWLFHELAEALSHCSLIVALLKSKVQLPLSPERFAESATAITEILTHYHPNRDVQEHNKEIMEDEIIETGGLPFLRDVALLSAFLQINNDEPTCNFDANLPPNTNETKRLHFGGTIEIDLLERTIRRHSPDYKHHPASFSSFTTPEPWNSIVELLKGEGSPVNLKKSVAKEMGNAAIRKMVGTLRRKLSPVGITIDNVGTNTWKVGLERP